MSISRRREARSSDIRPLASTLDVGSSRPPIGAPGIRPTYKDLHPNETEAEIVPCDLNGRNAQNRLGERERTVPSAYNDQNAYTRLIKRNIKAATLQNHSKPIAVADFDLPERGLIVFGLEDGNEEDQDNENAAHLVSHDRTTKTCFTTNKNGSVTT
ncbi:hypothetical protein OSTOST_15827 [Ostertagia ostertagi]